MSHINCLVFCRSQTEFDALPAIWDASPSGYYAFLARWGTHYVKSSSHGGQFRIASASLVDASADAMQIGAALSIVLQAAAIEASGTIRFSFGMKRTTNTMSNKFDYWVKGGAVAKGM